MNKKILLIPVIICCFFASGFLLLNILGSPGIASWVGDYTYTECLTANPDDPSYPQAPCINYSICIYEDGNEYYAKIVNQGYQTNTHIFAKVVGDSSKIDFVFENYLPENIFEQFSLGDLLLSFSKKEDRLYTTWNKLKSETAYIENQLTGMYYEKRR